MRLILDARVLIFKMLYQLSNTASTHAHISIHTLKSVVNISGGNLLFNKKPNDGTLTKETSLSAILYLLFIVMRCKLLMSYLTQRYDNS